MKQIKNIQIRKSKEYVFGEILEGYYCYILYLRRENACCKNNPRKTKMNI